MSTKTNHTHAGDPAAFIAPDYFERERRHIFKDAWICAAHVSQLKNPGDYVTLDLFGAPIVVVRGKDGEIRALSNVCLHRAMPVAEGAGNTHVLTCPYHLWAYDLDGQLKSAPMIRPESGVDLSGYRLPCLRTEVWQGFVFVTRDKEAAPLATQLAPLAEQLAPHDLEGLVHAGSMAYPSPWNWKILVENFMEAYHHIGAHRDTLQPVLPALKSAMLPLEGPYAVLEMPPVDEDHHPLWAACIYPNMLFALEPMAPAPFMTWYQMTNVRHDYFDLTVHLFLRPEAATDPEAVELAKVFTDAVHQEDIAMCQGVQAGLASPFATQGTLAPVFEAPIAHFRKWIDARMAS